jgi:hypothetical protein
MQQSDEPTFPQRVGYDPDAATNPGGFAKAPTRPPEGGRSTRAPEPNGRPAELQVKLPRFGRQFGVRRQPVFG